MKESLITHGLVKRISRSLPHCQLLYLAAQEFNVPLAIKQHSSYIAALRAVGVVLTILPEEPDLPDAAFVEDVVLIFDELAVICRSGCSSRKTEAGKMLPIVAELRPFFRIMPPGTLEGGDVLRLEKTLFVGLSSRTNREGIRQLEEIVRPFDYRVISVRVTGCLHLKTAITAPGRELLIANPEWIDPAPFRGFDVLTVPETEPWSANTLPVNGRVFIAGSAPRSAALLESRGLDVHPIDISELQKAEAGLTCLSVLYSHPKRRNSAAPARGTRPPKRL